MAVAQSGGAHAQTQAQASGAPGKGIEEIVVTASKRSEKLQKVAQSIQVLDSKKLSQQIVNSFDDYAKLIPSLSFQNQGPGFTTIYLRGVADGDNNNHSGPLPTVGTYIDEIPVTTIGGTLDVHIYDMARIEVLPGPQGTLYGGSSEAGTVRIISNKPNPEKFEAGYDFQGTSVDHGGLGYVAEGFVNIPINDKAAVRLVAFDERDAGFIDNIPATRTYQYTDETGLHVGGTINNAKYAGNNFNPNDTYGGRASALVNINDDWSVLGTALGQDTRNTGVFAYDPSAGYLKTQQFQPNSTHDRWELAGLTVTGRLGDYTLTYAGSLFERDVVAQSDYSDYSVAYYDYYHGSAPLAWLDKNGNPLKTPSQEIDGSDHFTKFSNEIRLASPATDRLRFIVGAFQEQQTHRIVQDYQIAGFDPALAVPGWPNTIWLTDQLRTDRDAAAFGEVTFDVTPQFSVTGGVRAYYYNNSLRGFYGFSENYGAKAACQPGKSYDDAPCVNLDKVVHDAGETHRINFSYKIDPDKLVYFTYSTGYRPGGVNRNGDLGAYQADTLNNYELGFKSAWLDHRLIFNTAFYNEDWNQFQYAFLGANSLTVIENAPAANIKGWEGALDFRATDQLTLSGGLTLTDAKLNGTLCASTTGPCSVVAPNGTQLPYTPSVKGNATARYTFQIMDWDAHVQGTVIALTRTQVGLRTDDKDTLGSMPAYATFDMTAGVEHNRLAFEMFIKNAFDEHGEQNRSVSCGALCTNVHVTPIQPMTIGLKLSQRF